MKGFAILIGACKIIPVSPKAAMILVAWLYGVYPGVPYDDYKTAYAEAHGDVAAVEQCFANWAPIDE